MRTQRLAQLRAVEQATDDGSLMRKIKAAISRIDKLEGRIAFLEMATKQQVLITTNLREIPNAKTLREIEKPKGKKGRR